MESLRIALTKRQKIELREIEVTIKAMGWALYSREAQKYGIIDPFQVPPQIDNLFAAYVMAGSFFFSGTQGEREVLADHIAEKILSCDVPKNKTLIGSLVNDYGNLIKNNSTFDLNEVERAQNIEKQIVWVQAIEKLDAIYRSL